MKLLLIDNYDSFTYNLCDYFLQAGAHCRVLRNDACSAAELDPASFDAIALSPGPGRPRTAGQMPDMIRRFHDTKPMLGICLGHQALGGFYGHRLCKAAEPVHGKTSPIRHNGHPLFEGIPPTFTVMRYHSLLLQNRKGSPLEIIAKTAQGEIMALAHRNLPLYGVQFHPESILTEYGMPLLKNWLQLAANWNAAHAAAQTRYPCL